MGSLSCYPYSCHLDGGHLARNVGARAFGLVIQVVISSASINPATLAASALAGTGGRNIATNCTTHRFHKPQINSQTEKNTFWLKQ
uniref:Uncharacterized protein n=1 Tax=Anopheles minimus TaxID=112268 RepID=A0A182W567_9DIPT